MNNSKWYMCFVAILGWAALILQFYLAIDTYTALGWTILGSVIQILSFFTILTNLLVTLSLSIVLIGPGSRLGVYFSKPSAITSIAVYITIVGLVYNLVLRPLSNPKGMDQVADELLHLIIPVLYVLYWLIIVSKGALKWKYLVPGSIYPLAYSIYLLIRGSMTGHYAYPFMDVNVHGYPTVVFNMFLVVMVYLLIGLIFLFIDSRMGKRALR
jgi:hypothetical protein